MKRQGLVFRLLLKPVESFPEKEYERKKSLDILGVYFYVYVYSLSSQTSQSNENRQWSMMGAVRSTQG